MRHSSWAVLLVSILCLACARGAFQPVNVGREYGDPVPIMVSHIGQGSPHYILQNIVCFDYLCRKQAGKKKAMRRISYEDFKKRLRKNAKRGEYKNLNQLRPTPRPAPKDSTIVKKDTVVIAASPTEPPHPSPVLASGDSLIVLDDLLFELNSAKLRDRHLGRLDTLCRFLASHPTISVSVTGHTDNTGAERHNVTLSTNRAQGVADYISKHGVSYDRISFEGFGSSRPVADNSTADGRQRNRRVEILLKENKR